MPEMLHDLSLNEVISNLIKITEVPGKGLAYHQEIARMVQKLVVQHLLQLAGDKKIMRQVSATALYQVKSFREELVSALNGAGNAEQAAHITYLLEQIAQYKKQPSAYKMPAAPKMPDGSPIGCGGQLECPISNFEYPMSK